MCLQAGDGAASLWEAVHTAHRTSCKTFRHRAKQSVPQETVSVGWHHDEIDMMLLRVPCYCRRGLAALLNQIGMAVAEVIGFETPEPFVVASMERIEIYPFICRFPGGPVAWEIDRMQQDQLRAHRLLHCRHAGNHTLARLREIDGETEFSRKSIRRLSEVQLHSRETTPPCLMEILQARQLKVRASARKHGCNRSAYVRSLWRGGLAAGGFSRCLYKFSNIKR